MVLENRDNLNGAILHIEYFVLTVKIPGVKVAIVIDRVDGIII